LKIGTYKCNTYHLLNSFFIASIEITSLGKLEIDDLFSNHLSSNVQVFQLVLFQKISSGGVRPGPVQCSGAIAPLDFENCLIFTIQFEIFLAVFLTKQGICTTQFLPIAPPLVSYHMRVQVLICKQITPLHLKIRFCDYGYKISHL